MKTINYLKLFSASFVIWLEAFTPAYSQFEISHTDYIPDVKSSMTYVPMNDTSTAIAAQYKAIFRKYWKFSKIQFIKYSDLGHYIKQNSSFITIESEITIETERNGNFINHYTYTGMWFELWVPDEKFFKKSYTEFKSKYKIPVARIPLYFDNILKASPESIYNMDYDFAGHVYNWSPGILKNYLQIISAFLDKGDAVKFGKRSEDENEIKKLREATLYLPSYVLIEYNPATAAMSARDEGKLMKEYKYKYKIMPLKNLDSLILDDSKPTYYLLFIRVIVMGSLENGQVGNYQALINSQTGDLIYTDHGISWNLGIDDMKSTYDDARGIKK
jgi:hypothetical protein